MPAIRLTVFFFSPQALLGLQRRTKVALHYKIVEATFADTFRSPKPARHENLLFCASLLIQLLVHVTEGLFERLGTMQSEYYVANLMLQGHVSISKCPTEKKLLSVFCNM